MHVTHHAPPALAPDKLGIRSAPLADLVVEHERGAPLQWFCVGRQIRHFQCGCCVCRVLGPNLVHVKLHLLLHFLLLVSTVGEEVP